MCERVGYTRRKNLPVFMHSFHFDPPWWQCCISLPDEGRQRIAPFIESVQRGACCRLEASVLFELHESSASCGICVRILAVENGHTHLTENIGFSKPEIRIPAASPTSSTIGAVPSSCQWPWSATRNSCLRSAARSRQRNYPAKKCSIT